VKSAHVRIEIYPRGGFCSSTRMGAISTCDGFRRLEDILQDLDPERLVVGLLLALVILDVVHPYLFVSDVVEM
jgi:hypothetical protein